MPNEAATDGAVAPRPHVTKRDGSELPHSFDPSNPTVSPVQEEDGLSRSLAPMRSPKFRPCDRSSATGWAPPAPEAVAGGVSLPTTALGELPSVKAMVTDPATRPARVAYPRVKRLFGSDFAQCSSSADAVAVSDPSVEVNSRRGRKAFLK